MPDIPVEQILVVPTALFHRLGYFPVFRARDGPLSGRSVPARRTASLSDRGRMEHDPKTSSN